jgi:dienelactone hydrolase
MKNTITSLMLTLFAATAHAQNSISIPYKELDGSVKQVEGILYAPKDGVTRQAVVLLHGAGGWKAERTKQYAEYLQRNGITSIDLRMFEGRPESPQKHLAQAYGAINHLAKQPGIDPTQISLVGTSYGGSLALYAATQWSQKKYAENGVKVKSISALYPTCFFHEGIAKRDARIGKRMEGFGFPADFYKNWSNIPIAIHIGDRDDFENKDSKSCQSFVGALEDADQKKNIQVNLYEGATHGWDHGETYSFDDPLACKWRGCKNTNQSNPELTVLVKDKILLFVNMK